MLGRCNTWNSQSHWLIHTHYGLVLSSVIGLISHRPAVSILYWLFRMVNNAKKSAMSYCSALDMSALHRDITSSFSFKCQHFCFIVIIGVKHFTKHSHRKMSIFCWEPKWLSACWNKQTQMSLPHVLKSRLSVRECCQYMSRCDTVLLDSATGLSEVFKHMHYQKRAVMFPSVIW